MPIPLPPTPNPKWGWPLPTMPPISSSRRIRTTGIPPPDFTHAFSQLSFLDFMEQLSNGQEPTAQHDAPQEPVGQEEDHESVDQPRLPPELIERVIRLIEDEATLAVCLRVSRSTFDIAGPQLYQTLRMSRRVRSGAAYPLRPADWVRGALMAHTRAVIADCSVGWVRGQIPACASFATLMPNLRTVIADQKYLYRAHWWSHQTQDYGRDLVSFSHEIRGLWETAMDSPEGSPKPMYRTNRYTTNPHGHRIDVVGWLDKQQVDEWNCYFFTLPASLKLVIPNVHISDICLPFSDFPLVATYEEDNIEACTWICQGSGWIGRLNDIRLASPAWFDWQRYDFSRLKRFTIVLPPMIHEDFPATTDSQSTYATLHVPDHIPLVRGGSSVGLLDIRDHRADYDMCLALALLCVEIPLRTEVRIVNHDQWIIVEDQVESIAFVRCNDDRWRPTKDGTPVDIHALRLTERGKAPDSRKLPPTNIEEIFAARREKFEALVTTWVQALLAGAGKEKFEDQLLARIKYLTLREWMADKDCEDEWKHGVGSDNWM